MTFPAVRGIRAAFVFLTRLPLGGFPYSAAELRWSSAHFPLAGAALGLLLLGVWHLSIPLGASVAAVLVMIAEVVATGALHEDALADTADALGGGTDRERIFAILKDSRIGAYAAVTLVLALLLRVLLLASLLPAHPALIVAVLSVSRAPSVWLLATLDYVTPAATARNSAIAASGFTQAGVATAWSAIVLFILSATGAISVLQALAMAAAAVAVGVLAGLRYKALLGGITGDLAGATVPISECALLLAAGLAGAG
ncbi:MAG TPA: adenosylcobinamide-GDP ribazoletransferase [Polyangiaceae bacterium]|nr:adenosylcobinamide-GDP ribazoletransferase [Polyangiaceae bacterium]